MTGILLDQGLPRTAGKILREKGWDVLHTGDIGLSRASDKEIVEYAKSENRVIVTLDSDFHAIIAVAYESKPSAIRIRQEGLKGSDLAALIENIWPSIIEHLESGAMVSVTEKSIRIRKIPLLSE